MPYGDGVDLEYHNQVVSESHHQVENSYPYNPTPLQQESAPHLENVFANQSLLNYIPEQMDSSVKFHGKSSGLNKKGISKSKKKKENGWAEDSAASTGGIQNSGNKRLRRNWTEEEEKKFLEALELFGRDWHKCAAYLGTRDVVSCRSHAQKYFIKLWINQEPLPKKVAEQGSGYTVSGKPLDPESSFVKYYMSLFDK